MESVFCVAERIGFLAFRESNKAISSLRENHGTLFQCLQVRVQNLRKWRLRDVETNLQDGILTDDDNKPEFRDIQEALAKPRLYQVCTSSVVRCQTLMGSHSRWLMNRAEIWKTRGATRLSLTVSLRLPALSHPSLFSMVGNLQHSITSCDALTTMWTRLTMTLRRLSRPVISLFTLFSLHSSPRVTILADSNTISR